MMKTLLLTVVTLFAAAMVQAQAQTIPPPPPMPPLLDDFVGGGFMTANQRGFYMDGVSISVKQAKNYARPYRQALRHIRRGQGWQIGGAILAGLGGGFIGIDIGSAIAGEKISGAGIAIGLILAGGGFGFELISISQYKKAAAAYNSSAGIVELPRREVTLDLATTGGGVGLQLTF